MSEPTGEIWYLGAPMEVDEAILREVGLKSGARVTDAGWRQIAEAKARRLAKSEASVARRCTSGAVGRWLDRAILALCALAVVGWIVWAVLR